MNEKFFHLPQEKQLAIINAGYRVFSQNSYRKSPMSEIAASAGISKSLLFHYFHNKKELYLFLWEECARIAIETLTEYGCYQQQNFFDMLESGMHAKFQIVKQYPYMGSYVMKAFFETEPDIQETIQSSYRKLKSLKAYVSLESLDDSQFIEGVDTQKVWREIYLASEGYLWEFQKNSSLHKDTDIEKLKKNFTEMIAFWKSIYLRKESETP